MRKIRSSKPASSIQEVQSKSELHGEKKNYLFQKTKKKEIYYSHHRSSKFQPYYRNATLRRLLPFNHATIAKSQPKIQLSNCNHSGCGVPKVQAQVYRKQSPPVMIPLMFMSTSDTLMEEHCLDTHKGEPRSTRRNLPKAQSTGLAWPFLLPGRGRDLTVGSVFSRLLRNVGVD